MAMVVTMVIMAVTATVFRGAVTRSFHQHYHNGTKRSLSQSDFEKEAKSSAIDLYGEYWKPAGFAMSLHARPIRVVSRCFKTEG